MGLGVSISKVRRGQVSAVTATAAWLDGFAGSWAVQATGVCGVWGVHARRGAIGGLRFGRDDGYFCFVFVTRP